MKQGRSLQDLAREIERQAQSKKDYIADTRQLSMLNDDGVLKFYINDIGTFNVKNLAHRQISDRLGIPAKYYNRIRLEAPDLLVNNVNYWFHNKPEDRLVRTLDGNVRAFLSNRYRRLDNYELMEAILPTLAEVPELEIKSCEITESRLYLKAVTARVEDELEPGDIVNAGVVISNSEVGLGTFKVEPLIFRLVCSNGMIAADHILQKYHVGRKISTEEAAAMELLSDEALEADDKAFWLKARDIVKGALAEDTFKRIVKNMREANNHKIEGDPTKAVQELSNHFKLTQEDTGGILRCLIEEGNLSKLGLANAITRYSKEVEDYDYATEIERLGGKVVTLDNDTWKIISTAA